ncbi:MAG: efflux RND transporter periplasmic adaptor subunit [Desulfobulbaceae bacterium]|nr:MAG: efflux RND transporter periplasmic adaptor subunit [Desulfobulbaceae bacterium]
MRMLNILPGLLFLFAFTGCDMWNQQQQRPKDAFAVLDLAAAVHEHPEGQINFTVEQQQMVDFAVVTVEKSELYFSLPVFGTLKAAAGREANIRAPVSGYLSSSKDGFPRFGDKISKGGGLVKIVPSLGEETDPASLDLEVRRSRANYQLAGKELDRLEILLGQGAVSEQMVQEARRTEQVAQAEHDAAISRFKRYFTRPREGKSSEAAALVVSSPITGILDGVYVTPGAYLQEGDTLFHVVDTSWLQLTARIPEADISRLLNPRGAWFTVDGFVAPFKIDLEQHGDRLVTLGSVVDPGSRTVPLVFEFPNVDNKLRIGMFAQVNVIVGETREAIAVPVAALQRVGGLSVVYVQTGSETFERRMVRLGVRDRDLVEIKDGVSLGEKVVTRGSYFVQLAAVGAQEIGHGHAH